MKSDDATLQQQQLEQMTTEQLSARIEHNRQEMTMFLEQLCSRASVQEYTEQQHSELLALLQEVLTFLEDIPIRQDLIGRRNELIVKLKRKV